MTTTWMVRSGTGGVRAQEFLESGRVEVGFAAELLGPFKGEVNRDAVMTKLRAARPEKSEASLFNSAAQLVRFHREFAIGDSVVTYDPAQRHYYLGVITSDVIFADGEESRYCRSVTWSKRVSRDALSPSARNSLGSSLTLFLVNDELAAELDRRAVAINAPADDHVEVPGDTANVDASLGDRAALDEIYGSVEEKAREFIDDLIVSLDPDEMEELVAGILRAMGYKSRRSPKGPDRGIDVIASPDGLGLEEPRIFAEVKHRRNTTIGAPAIRAFLGGRKPGDRCLFISTGGFTREAKYEAERATVPLTLVDLPLLRDLLLEHYEQADSATRRLVPLTRMYWPSLD